MKIYLICITSLLGLYPLGFLHSAFILPEQGITIDISKASEANIGGSYAENLLEELETLQMALAKELQSVMYQMGPMSSIDSDAVVLEFRRQNLNRYARVRAMRLEISNEREAVKPVSERGTKEAEPRAGILFVEEETITDQAIRIEREYQDKLEAKLAEALLLNANEVE